MSNDSEYQLTFYCPSRDKLKTVIDYLERKKARWDAWRSCGKESEALMSRVGATHVAAVVSWGFDFGEVQMHKDGEASVSVFCWANENLMNIHISGSDGELADLLRKFPVLESCGHYEDEYGQGQMKGFAKC